MGSSRDDGELSQFDRFLREWSRRDFLRGMGGTVALSLFLAGGEELLAACGGDGHDRAQTGQDTASRTPPDPRTLGVRTTTQYAPCDTSLAGTVGISPKHVHEKLQPEEMNAKELDQVPQVVSGVRVRVKWDKG